MSLAVVLLCVAVAVLALQFRQPAGWIAFALAFFALLSAVGLLHRLGI